MYFHKHKYSVKPHRLRTRPTPILLQSECTFNGAWGGSKVPAVFYISSYFWDRAQDVGLIPNDKVRRSQSTPRMRVLWGLLTGLLDYWPAVSRKQSAVFLRAGKHYQCRSAIAGNLGCHQPGGLQGQGRPGVPDANDQPRLGVCLGERGRAQCVNMSCLVQVVNVNSCLSNSMYEQLHKES